MEPTAVDHAEDRRRASSERRAEGESPSRVRKPTPERRRVSVDVYLVSRIRWQPMMPGAVVKPDGVFKIGFSENPFDRVDQLRTTSPYNLALWGVILCRNTAAARETERECHALLDPVRGRGEWFKQDVDVAWAAISRAFRGAALWLTDWYSVDLDTMRLTVPPLGGWGGAADNYHAYRSYKTDGVLSGPFEKLAA